jgi:Cu+-exporting ATPase
MQAERPTQLIDSVCGMTIDVARAEEAGLLVEHEGRTYAFCRAGCRRAFLESPDEYVTKAEAAVAVAAPTSAKGLPLIDQGMRLWYESCACCLSDAFPEIKAQLDAERSAVSTLLVDAAPEPASTMGMASVT